MGNANIDTAEARDGSAGSSTLEGEKVNVFLRLRPMNKLELSRRSKNCIIVHPYNFHKKKITVDSHLDGEHKFSFDEVFEEIDSDQLVYDRVVSPLASKLMEGYNVALVAFGQAKSGKNNMILGKSISLEVNENSTSSHSNEENNGESNQNKDSDPPHDGIIEKLSHDLFQRMKNSSEDLEFTVKVSYIEIYLENIRDLLNPKKRFLKIKEADDFINQYNLGQGPLPKIEGLSEICCISANDAIALVKRGHAYRVVGEERKQTDLARSHSILSIKIEQKNLITERTITSTFVIANTTGSDMDRIKEGKLSLKNSPHSFQLGKAFVKESHSALDSVVKSLESDSISPKRSEVFKESTLTNILSDALGGNSHCSILLAASPASTSIKETLNSIRVGERLRRINNHPIINVQPSPRECIIELEKSKNIQSELLHLVREVSEEIQRVQGKTSDMPLEPDIWNALNRICSKNKYFEQDSLENANVSRASMTMSEELKLEKERTKILKDKLGDTMDAKDMAQNAIDMLQGECLFLRRESDEVLQAKKRNTIDLIESQNEIQTLNHRRLQAEHNLRTSRFRESEAVLFLRHFRRFYRRLLENVHAQGSGDLANMCSHIIGAPDLGGLIDIDKLLMESGFLEDFEVGQETNKHEYRPSSAALLRSSIAARKSKYVSPPCGSIGASSLVQHPQNLETKSLEGHSTGLINTVSELVTPSDIPMDMNISDTVDANYTSPDISKHYSGNIEALLLTTNRKAGKSPWESPSTQVSPAAQLSEKRVNELEKEVLTMTQRCMELQTKLNNTEDRLEAFTSNNKNVKKHQSAKEAIGLNAEMTKRGADLEAVIWKMNELHLVNRSYNDRLLNRDEHVTYLKDSLRLLQDSNARLVTVHIENENKLRHEAERLNQVIESLTTQLWQEGAVKIPLESRIIVPFQGSFSSNDRIHKHLINEKYKQRNIEGRDTQDSGRNDKDTQHPIPFTSVELSPNVDLNTLLKGGKTNDFVPRRFTEKRGRTIKSATISSFVSKASSSKSVGSRPRSFSGSSRGSDSIDLATVREQINQLDLLTKSWQDRTHLTVNE